MSRGQSFSQRRHLEGTKFGKTFVKMQNFKSSSSKCSNRKQGPDVACRWPSPSFLRNLYWISCSPSSTRVVPLTLIHSGCFRCRKTKVVVLQSVRSPTWAVCPQRWALSRCTYLWAHESPSVWSLILAAREQQAFSRSRRDIGWSLQIRFDHRPKILNWLQGCTW